MDVLGKLDNVEYGMLPQKRFQLLAKIIGNKFKILQLGEIYISN